jgi:hypothetical protein
VQKLISFYKKNKGSKPLFSIFDIFDWYDGATSGIANLSDTQDYYLFDMVAWDINSHSRVFTIVNITSSWLDKFKDARNKFDSNLILQLMENYIHQHSGDVFLMKSQYVDDVEYDLIRDNSNSLQIYKSVEDIANQSEKEKQKWFNLFR